MSATPVFTDLRRTFEWTCPECGSDHYDAGEVDGQILTCEGCSKTVLVRWPGLSAEGVVAEKPLREYTFMGPNGSHDDYAGLPTTSLEQALDIARLFPGKGQLFERIVYKDGPWVPVHQEGASS